MDAMVIESRWPLCQARDTGRRRPARSVQACYPQMAMIRFEVVGLIAIVSGLLILLSGVRQTDENLHAKRQVTFSLCGFMLVVAGLGLMHAHSTTEQAGPCSFADAEDVQRDALSTRCYHGAPRRPLHLQ